MKGLSPVSVLILAALAPVAVPAGETETFRNERVVVIQGATKPGAAETLSGKFASVTVYLTAGTLEVVPTAGQPRRVTVKRGEALFEAAGARTVKNAGTTEVTFARIEFLGAGTPEVWGAAGLSPNYKMLFENQYTRVYDIQIAAGVVEPKHSHKDRVVVCLSGAEMSHLLPDGRDEPSTLKTGEAAWRRGGTHIGRNLGKTDLWVIAVEPK